MKKENMSVKKNVNQYEKQYRTFKNKRRIVSTSNYAVTKIH